MLLRIAGTGLAHLDRRVAAGAALGSRLANESGGDFNNLKGAVTGGCAAGGALIGMAVGAAVRRGTVVYQR